MKREHVGLNAFINLMDSIFNRLSFTAYPTFREINHILKEIPEIDELKTYSEIQ